MSSWAGLLRGINVGKAKRIAMADLRAIVEQAGYTKVRTLLNSGNVVFEGPKGDAARIASRLEAAIEKGVGFHSRVVVVDGSVMDTVVREQTLTHADNPSRLLVAFVQDRDRLKALDELGTRDWGDETMAVGTHAAYVWMPAGVLESPMFEHVAKVLGNHMTTRNWATVQKLHAMMRG
jgi:uncharacterized protein (DUF1697 family)